MNTTRRGVLALGTAAAVALAGCSGSGDDGESPPEPTSNETQTDSAQDTADTGDSRTVTVTVQPEPGALREAQVEIANALDSGEIDRQQAREQLAERERELLSAATEDAEAWIEGTALQQLETIPPQGVLLVEGDPGAILDLLGTPMVNAIVGEQEFEVARQREASAGNESSAGGLPDGDSGNETDG